MEPEDEDLARLAGRALAAGKDDPAPGFEDRVLRAVHQQSHGASRLARPGPAPHRLAVPPAGRREGGPGHGRRVRRMLAAAAVAAVVLGAAGAVRAGLLGGSHPTPTRHGTPSAKAVSAAMLAAFRGPEGQVTHDHETTTGGPQAATSVEDLWMTPSLPQPGDQVRFLYEVRAGLEGPARAGWITYTEPASPGPVSADTVTVDYVARTWSERPAVGGPGASVPWSDPTKIHQAVANGEWKVVGPAQQQGRRAIELSRSRPAPKQTEETLWVDAQTFLPLRKVSRFLFDHMTVADDYEFLPATPATLPRFQPAVPPGFARVASAR